LSAASIKIWSSTSFFSEKKALKDLTYAQNAEGGPWRETSLATPLLKTDNTAKSLISLTSNSCSWNGHFDRRLDFQGFRGRQTDFSTKLSTENLERSQNRGKSST
jgi:hypothetical protein